MTILSDGHPDAAPGSVRGGWNRVRGQTGNSDDSSQGGNDSRGEISSASGVQEKKGHLFLHQPGPLACSTPWDATDIKLGTVTGQTGDMHGRCWLPWLRLGLVTIKQEFFQVDITNPCILGLDALANAGVTIDTAEWCAGPNPPPATIPPHAVVAKAWPHPSFSDPHGSPR
ncbi:hypothetical protein SKAU_G00070170 [Synaphobranchus kaupii]|uniref:Uncharacterized protein n=1 Tax=Synaphobranchus kaupii TaxID=118154 RepID=A0A9Q1G7P1_SYNKA|nr:hypothetical protein SKAU_G00070170 [Synaphobranchus kaupii]